MKNRSTVALILLLAFATPGCPTRIVGDAPDGGSGGSSSGGRGGGGGGQAGGASGGHAGSPEKAGAGGNGGAAGTGGSGGSAGQAGAGGAAGAITTGGVGGTPPGSAGTAGQGGMAGSGGAAGAAGVASTGGAGGAVAKANDGQPCALPADCASGACTPFYVDLDGDGYGAGQAHGFCGTAAPIGYAAQTGDCCDTATNLAVAKLIHPGADFQTTSAGGVCNVTWDYDCSGTVEQSAPNVLGCTPYPECYNVNGPFPDTECGQRPSVGSCGTSTTNTTACVMHGASPGTLGCK